MGKNNFFKRFIITPILGLLFATFLLTSHATPVAAEPTQNTTLTESQIQDHSSIYNETSLETLENRTSDNTNPNQSNNRTSDTNAVNQSENTTNQTENVTNTTNQSANRTTSTSNQDSDSATDSPNCYDTVGSLGWVICPITTAISSAVDTLYGIINHFLAIEPITFNENSAIYIVWGTSRDIANVVFIILLLVVIFSQLTGVGFDNYNIKKTLPRIVIAAILVNLSFIICSLAVDASNIIGASANGFFDSITVSVKQNSANGIGELSWQAIIGQMLGTAGGLTVGAGALGAAIAVAGGLGSFIWLLIPVIVGAIISLAIGVFTIALRQAVVALLVMIAPLAFVAYLLPNTEQYFKKWKDYLVQMLIFFPMFAVLFGASNLAGWAFITTGVQNQSIFQIIIGMAVQVFPLIASFKLLQMSNTILGKVSSTLQGLSQPLRNTISTLSATQAATKKAQYDAKNLSRDYTGINRINPARLRSFAAKRQAILDANRKLAEDNRQKILEAYTVARSINKDIKHDDTGRMVFSNKVMSDTMNDTMKLTMQNKEASLNLSGLKLEADNNLSQAGTYVKTTGLNDAKLNNIISRQAKNYLDLETQTNAKRRNDISDKKFYADQVLAASKIGADGKPVDRSAYENLVVTGGGVDAIKNYDYRHGKIGNNATASVIANAYDFTEAERQNEIKRFTTYLDTQATQTVEKAIEESIDANDVNNLIAGLNVLDVRGDDDLVEKYVRNYMNSGKLKLGTEDANNLGKALLGIKKAPVIRRLGKYINVETRSYTDGNRGRQSQNAKELQTITYDEYITGVRTYTTDTGQIETYQPKGNVASFLEGTSHKDMERTAMQALMQSMYGGVDGTGQKLSTEMIHEINNKILPQLVSAVPSYDSGSEPLISIIEYITGMKRDAKDGNKWKSSKRTDDPNNIRKDVDFQEFAYLSRKYLNSFTANDLVSMKSDMLGAIQALFKEEYSNRVKNGEHLDQNNAEDYVKAEFKKIFSSAKDVYVSNIGTINGNGVLNQLRSGDSSAYNGMKNPLRQLLDLETETPST